MSYKRNQIEEAIGRIFNPDSEKQLLTRLKRLLELDRALGRKNHSVYRDCLKGQKTLFSEDAPGTGADISFSEYEVFALLNGLRIMQHSRPPGLNYNHAPRASQSRKRAHPDSQATSGQAIRHGSHMGKGPSGRHRGRQYRSGVFFTLASKDDATTRPRPAVCREIEKVHSFRRDVGASSIVLFGSPNSRPPVTRRADEDGTKASGSGIADCIHRESKFSSFETYM